jgi:hypothetical protein
MNGEESTEFVVVFKTGKLVEIDAAVTALEEKGIPYFMREETSGGLRLAMPAAPAMGPGTWYSILVPKQSRNVAKKVLKQLPFEIKTKPGVWDFGPRHRIKFLWILFLIIIFMIWLIMYVAGIIKRLI